jgi:hypothetical protein
MSIDYQIYLDAPIPEQILVELGLISDAENEAIVRGTMGDEDLFTYLVRNPGEDSFTREELKFAPVCKLILSPNLDHYENGMQSLIAVLNAIVPIANTALLYMNNELLLLNKNSYQTLLHTEGNDWWDEHIPHITFSYAQC